MKQNSIVSGSKWALVSNFYQLICGIIYSILVTRLLGANTFGLLETILSVIIILVLFNDFGISRSVSRFIAKNIDNKNRLLEISATGLVIKLVSIILGSLVLYFIMPILDNLFKVKLSDYTIFIVLLLLLRSFNDYFLRQFQGLRRLDVVAFFNISKGTVHLILVTVSLFLGYGIGAILLSEILILFLINLGYVYLLIKHQYFSLLKFSIDTIKEVIMYSFPMFIIAISFIIYMRSDVLMIQYFYDSYQVGLYSLATLIVTKLQTPFTAISAATSPVFARLEIEKGQGIFMNTFKISLILALPMSVGLYLVAEPLVEVVFGRDYSESIDVLKIYCVFMFFYCLNAVFSPIMDYIGKAKVRSVFIVISAILNIVLNLILIPKFSIVGAAISTLITYTIYSLVLNISIIKLFISKDKFLVFLNIILKVTICSLIMAISVFIIKKLIYSSLLYLIFAVICGAIIYSMSLIYFKVISINEIKTFFLKSK